ncbi:hypothetical protein TOI97_06555, partial [Denitrificimonas sp. JX-1]|nr:hypothetical protein [Denitrificimonas sp. JX-1]
MTSQERQQFWQQYIGVWQASDSSGAAFCKQHDLNYAQFNYWRRKFQSVCNPPSKPQRLFVENSINMNSRSFLCVNQNSLRARLWQFSNKM